MTSTVRGYASRVKVRFRGKDGEIVLDQIRTVDRERLVKKWGILPEESAGKVCDTLVEMFTC